MADREQAPGPRRKPLFDSSGHVAVRVSIHGRVQGVWFRGWTVENARALGLDGWVRNRRDGTVEALYSGPPDAVRRMIRLCGRGPPPAHVDRVDSFYAVPVPDTGFEQRETA